MFGIKTRATARLLFPVVLAAAVSVCGIGPAVALPPLPGAPAAPAQDEFYTQPDDLTGRGMGEVLDSRPVTLRDVPARVPLTAWQVKYVSQDTKGVPWTTVATIIQPVGGARLDRLVAYDPWIDALDPRCNPSYQLRAGAPFMAGSGMLTEMINLAVLLDRGYTVVVPDYLGPRNHFTAAYVEGRNTLDGIRAALGFAPAGLARSAPVGMFGYSGGARGTEFAAELAAEYAPELNLVGTVAIGLPVDLRASGWRMNKTLFAGLDVASALGLARAYPELGLAEMFTDPQLEQRISDLCNVEIQARYAFADGHDMTFGRRWPLDEPAVVAAVDSIRAGQLGTPAAPLYLAVAENDQVALPADNDRLAADYRARGVALTYVKVPLADHVSSISVAGPPAMTWLSERLDGAA